MRSWLLRRRLLMADGLKMYMAQYGEIDSCVVMRDPSGRSRGFAFLTYKHPSSVTKVLEKTHHLDGKQVGAICGSAAGAETTGRG